MELLSYNAYCSGIFHLDGRGSLFTSHFIEVGADGYSCLCVNEDGAILSFSFLFHDVAHDFHTTSMMPLTVGNKFSGFLGLGGPSLRKWTPLDRILD